MRGLVDYSSSSDEDHDHDTDQPAAKRQRTEHHTNKQSIYQPVSLSTSSTRTGVSNKPALPSVSEMINNQLTNPASASNPRADPSLDHSGRVRSFPHVEGNWPTHVYISIEQAVGQSGQALSKLITECVSANQSINSSQSTTPNLNMIDQADLHLSLSRTFTLRHHLIDSFLTSLNKAINQSIKQSTLRLSSYHQYVNDERTRAFAAIGFGNQPVTQNVNRTISQANEKFTLPMSNNQPLNQPTNQSIKWILKAIHTVDGVMTAYQKPVYYTNPSPHVSFAWWLPEKSNQSLNQSVNQSSNQSSDQSRDMFAGYVRDTSSYCDLRVTSIDCRVGDRIHSYKLSI